MESSKVLGGTEEYGSSESGWTMYIVSPSHEYDSYNDDDDRDDQSTGRKEDVKDDDDDDDESDDSMASDASSGPSHRELPCGSSKRSQVMGHFKHAEEDQRKCSSGKKPYKQADMKIYGRTIKPNKEDPRLNEKVRKPNSVMF